MTRDGQRAKVYAAEGFVRTMFDRAAERGNPVVDFFGTQLTLPPEGRLGPPSGVPTNVSKVWPHPAARHRGPPAPRRRVRPRRGAAAAHYERVDDVATIAVPQGREMWALRELVVLHEIAHHLCDADPPHGPAFVATFCELAATVMGAEVAHVLRVVYAREGVK